MARTATALVTPNVLAWARQAAGYEPEAAAKKARVSDDALLKWEAGEAQPTIAQARKLASIYRRPLAVFFLPEPPREFTPLGDFRRLPEGVPESFSPALRFLVRTCVARQEWARDYLQYLGEGESPFVGSARRDESRQGLAARIRAALGVRPEEIRGWRGPGEALRGWTDHVEATGIFVCQSGDTDPAEARGLSFPDPLAPLVWINSKDSVGARVFSLIHEVVHVWLGAGGVSNLVPFSRAGTDAQKTEVFCNAVAAEVVAPLKEVTRTWRSLEASQGVPVRIATIAAKFRVSREVIARRLLDIRAITRQTYRSLRETYQQEWTAHKERERRREGGPSYARLVASASGHAFTRLVVQAYSRGEAGPRDVSGLLNTKLKHIPDVAVEAGTTVA